MKKKFFEVEYFPRYFKVLRKARENSIRRVNSSSRLHRGADKSFFSNLKIYFEENWKIVIKTSKFHDDEDEIQNSDNSTKFCNSQKRFFVVFFLNFEFRVVEIHKILILSFCEKQSPVR